MSGESSLDRNAECCLAVVNIFRTGMSLNVTGNLRNETDFNYNKFNICPIAQVVWGKICFRYFSWYSERRKDRKIIPDQ